MKVYSKFIRWTHSCTVTVVHVTEPPASGLDVTGCVRGEGLLSDVTFICIWRPLTAKAHVSHTLPHTGFYIN